MAVESRQFRTGDVGPGAVVVQGEGNIGIGAINSAEAVHALFAHLEQLGRKPWTPGEHPRAWRVPHAPHRNFTGRDDLVSRLRAGLVAEHRGACALAGLGGVGKTQLALAFAHRYQTEYEAIWWIRAEDESTLKSDYADLGVAVGAASADEADQAQRIAETRRWLGSRSRTLLIFDNAVAPAIVETYLSGLQKVHALITSRDPNWGRIADVVPVTVWQADEATAFLLKRTGRNDADDAGILAEMLGCLPLALEQAGAYIEMNPLSFAAYRELFQHHERRALEWRSPHSDYPSAVATTWQMAFQELETTAPASAELLNLCAFLAPDSIPVGVVRQGAAHLASRSELALAAGDDWQWNGAIGRLRQYSLISMGDGDVAFSVHRLVQMVLRDRLGDKALAAWAKTAVDVMVDGFPSDPTPLSLQQDQLLSHALAALDHADGVEGSEESSGSLLNQVGAYLHRRGELQQARVLLERACAIREHADGPGTGALARSLNDLALVLQDQGHLDAARSRLERALTIREQQLPVDETEVAESLNNFALLLRAEHHTTAARPYLERALSTMQRAHGEESKLTATTLNNLGVLFQDEGDLAAAGSYMVRALHVLKRVVGPEHPDTATSLNNVGALRRAEGELPAARSYFEQALQLREKVLGAEHPATAESLFNLASVTLEQGESAYAHSLFERALTVRVRVLGPEHQETVTSIYALGFALQKEGIPAAAVACFQRALRICQCRGYRQQEAAGFIHMGQLALELGRIESSAALMAVACLMLGALGESSEGAQQTLYLLANQLGRGQDQLATLMRNARSSYAADGGNALIHRAFGQDLQASASK